MRMERAVCLMLFKAGGNNKACTNPAKPPALSWRGHIVIAGSDRWKEQTDSELVRFCWHAFVNDLKKLGVLRYSVGAVQLFEFRISEHGRIFLNTGG